MLVPPFPGITSATGLLTSDLKYDQMRTVFMVQGGVDAARIDRELADLAATVKGRLLEDGLPESDIELHASLDVRYVGQGYELRVPLAGLAYSDEAIATFHRLHEQEYGHAPKDPIEIVNLRVTAIGKRPKLGKPEPSSGTLAEALLGEGDGVFRVDGQLRTLPTRYLDRAMLPLGEPIAGPCVVFQRDTTVLVPPGWTAVSDPSGNLLLHRH
ncbi:MAG: hypothetical protein R3C15_05215 [Thermoleophilia bacterium]